MCRTVKQAWKEVASKHGEHTPSTFDDFLGQLDDKDVASMVNDAMKVGCLESFVWCDGRVRSAFPS
jgi:hypothetical protein